jgi:hypothetical protein
MGTPGTPNIEILDPWGTPSFLIPLFFSKSASNFPIIFIYLPHLRNVMESESELESESVGSSDEEVTFALLHFPAVNVIPLPPVS